MMIFLIFSIKKKKNTDKHSPIKQKRVKGNGALLRTREFGKAIMDRSRLRNKHQKYLSRENFVNMKKMKNKCNPVCRKSKIKYLKRSIEKGISSSKKFWNFFKPFLTNKGCMTNDFISVRDGNAFMDKESKLVEKFNSHYINTVEETLGVSPESYVINTNNT